MLIETLKKELEDLFEIVAFIDLSDVRKKHRSVFDVFKLFYKAVYDDNQRLVLYTQHDPEQEFLDHIQRAASRIDISNFFILIVCPHDIQEKLKTANKKYGNDDVFIKSLIRPLADTGSFVDKNFYKIETLCPLPFSQMHVNNSGKTFPCCKFNGHTGDLSGSTLQDEFHRDKIVSIRNQMLDGKFPDGCSVCWENEKTGTTSFRQLAMQKYGDALDQEWIDDIQLRDLTWSPASLCNFTCRICDSRFSSSIAVEEIKFSTDPEHRLRLKNQIKIDSDKNIKLIESLKSLKNLEFLHVLGGEPFIWPNLPKMIDTLISEGISDRINLEFNTNGSIYPEDQISKIIENFKSVEVLLSIDNIGKKFEIERGGRWDDVSQNIIRFANLRSNKIKIKLAVTVNLQNVLYLDEILNYAGNLGIEILWWYLETPEFLCIDYPTEKVKEIVVSKYRSHKNRELRKIAERVSCSTPSDGRSFLDYAQKLDQRRGQNFSVSHKEIYEYMGGCVFPKELVK